MTIRTAYTNTITNTFTLSASNDSSVSVTATLYETYNTTGYTNVTNKSKARLVLTAIVNGSSSAVWTLSPSTARVYNYGYTSETPTWTISGLGNQPMNSTVTLLDQECDVTHDTDGRRAVQLQIGALAFRVNLTTTIFARPTVSFDNTKVWFTTYNRKPTISITSSSVDVGTAINVVASAPISDMTIYVVENGNTITLGTISGSSGTLSYTCPTSLISSYTTQDYVPVSFYGTNSAGTGSTTTKNFNIPATYKPSVTSLTYTDVSTTKPSKYSQLIQSISQLSCSISASGNTGSTIQTYSTNTGVNTYSGATFTTQTLTATNYSFSTTVTDSRNRTSDAYTTSITCDAYSLPIISSISCYRCDSTGAMQTDGTYARCIISYAISSLNSLNTKALSVSVDSGTATSVTLSSYSGTDFDLWTNGYQPSGITANAGHTITFSLTDDFDTYTISANISVATPHMDYVTDSNGNIGVGVGVRAEVSKIKFGLPLYYGTNAMDFVIENGTSGDWTYEKWYSGLVTARAKVHDTNQAITTQSQVSTFYRIASALSLSIPTGLVIAQPNINAMCYCSAIAANIFVTIHSVSTTEIKYIYRNTASATVAGITTDFQLYGKWK